MKGKSLALLMVSLFLVLGLGGGIGGLWKEARAEEPAPPGTRLLASAMGTAFTYQGRLVKDGNAVNDTCDFKFSLHDAASGARRLAPPRPKSMSASATGSSPFNWTSVARPFRGTPAG